MQFCTLIFWKLSKYFRENDFWSKKIGKSQLFEEIITKRRVFQTNLDISWFKYEDFEILPDLAVLGKGGKGGFFDIVRFLWNFSCLTSSAGEVVIACLQDIGHCARAGLLAFGPDAVAKSVSATLTDFNAQAVPCRNSAAHRRSRATPPLSEPPS